MPEPISIGGRRVVVKFRPEIRLPYTDSAKDHLKKWTGTAWTELAERYPGTTFEPYFSSVKLPVLRKFERLKPVFGPGPISLTSFFVIDNAANFDREKIAREFKQLKGVEYAYAEPGLVGPPSLDPLNVDQKFQDDAPVGIGSRQFAIDTGAAGAGVGFVDVEQGWKLDHDDLPAAAISPPLWGENLNDKNHGTNVLGVVLGTAGNDVGGKGIAPAADAGVVSIVKAAMPGIALTGPAILHAACALSSGDVLLLEVQTRHSNAGNKVVPVEVDPAVYQVIRAATSLGITVVEAAANGAFDLDSFNHPDAGYIFQKGHVHFRDSGAILVGAAQSADFSREPTTNFGTRVDCFAWGDGILTTGTDAAGTTSTYPNTFGNTSGAAAIVAGAAVLLQSWRRATTDSAFGVARLRELLSMRAINTKSQDEFKDLIGVMPDLGSIRRYLEGDGGTVDSADRIDGAIREMLGGESAAKRDRTIALAAARLAKYASSKPVGRALAKSARRILKETEDKWERSRKDG